MHTLEIESKKKSVVLAAALNLVFPGIGYMYCKRPILGAIVLIAAVAMAASGKMLPLVPVLGMIACVDGLLAALRYNKKLINEALNNLKECPKCAESVQMAAKVCKHCNHEFSGMELKAV